jgi:ATP-dependent RNA helicase RhlE
LTTDAKSHGPQRQRRGGRRGSGGGRRPHRPSSSAASPSSTRESSPFDPAPVPFRSLITDTDLLDALEQRGFEKTTPIQSAVLPYALEGRDVIGCAETGTGKTAAYLLPILSRLLRENREGYRAPRGITRALILAPTRELATQIDDEIQGFAYHAPVSSVAVYGGVPIEPQARALQAGVDIVVATPGRLLDHMRSSVGDFSKLEIFVLDEADRMMDMGFWPDVRRIAEALPPTTARQTMLFSATMPDEVMRFADALAPSSVFIQVGSRRGPAQTISHEARILPTREKPSFLAKYLRKLHEPAIVFVNTKVGCDRLARQLHSAGLRAVAIHADRSQKDRTAAIEAFRSGRIKVLVATDVAARGLDIESVGLIVNYEVPHGLDSYVHRVGRTGRNDATGHALTLADPHERADLEQVEKAFGLKLLNEHATAADEARDSAATHTTHPRTAELVDLLDRTRADLRRAVDAVPAERRGDKPDADRWSVAEVLEHLSIVETRIAGVVAKAIADAKPSGLARETSTSSVLTSMNLTELANRERRLTAGDASRPTGTVGADEAWAALTRARKSLYTALREGDGWALEMLSAPHPRLGALNLYQWVVFVAGHEARHAAQIREIGSALAAAASA